MVLPQERLTMTSVFRFMLHGLNDERAGAKKTKKNEERKSKNFILSVPVHMRPNWGYNTKAMPISELLAKSAKTKQTKSLEPDMPIQLQYGGQLKLRQTVATYRCCN